MRAVGRRWKLAIVAGLGLWAGAFSQAGVARGEAQALPRPGGDTTARAPADTTRRDPVRTDTIKAPLGRAPAVPPTGVAPAYRWEKDRIFATGAYTLAELFDRVPGYTTFRSGWIATPQLAAVGGDFNRVRIFLDGVEVDAIDPRTRGLHDFAHVPIWALDEIAFDRTAGDTRVNLRSWSVDRTTAYTRTDISTGNEQTDVYRGYYGKRYFNGGVLQLAGQQSATENVRNGGGGDHLSLVGRVGVGRRSWSVDAFAERTHYGRAVQTGFLPGGIAPYDATHTLAYLRAAVGRQERGPWMEAIAATQGVKESSRLEVTRAATLLVPPDTVDTIVSRAQYVLRGGWRRGGFDLRGFARHRVYAGNSNTSLGGSGAFERRWFSVSGWAERDDERRMRTMDVQAVIRPLTFIAIGGSYFNADPDSDSLGGAVSYRRGEAALRVFGAWLYGGVLARPVGVFPAIVPSPAPRSGAPSVYDSAYRSITLGSHSATFGGVRGVFWKGVGADAYVVRWSRTAIYVPEYQARAELNYESEWRSRFPRGDFTFRLAVADEFRSKVAFPATGGQEVAGASHALWGLMEIRIMRAVLSIQTRNPIGRQYFIVPGFEAPRNLTTYGVRWYFWG